MKEVARKTSGSRRILSFALAAAAPAAAALLGAACAQPPEERVAELRSRYEATLLNFVIRETPLVDQVPPLGEEPIGEVPVRQDVVLDILVRHDNHENLPGLTVEVAQLGEGASEELSWEEVASSARATWRVYLDTAAIGRGEGSSVLHKLEDVSVAPGDRFVVTVRDPVPPGERADYRELSEAS